MPWINGKYVVKKGRIRKFSPQAEKELVTAVSRYNQMRTRFIKTGGETIAPKVTVQELKEAAKNTQELRQAIKRLNDYKKVSDFETKIAKGFRIKTTQGERRTLSRLDRAARQRYKKGIAELEAQKTTASNQELINKIIPDIEALKQKPTVIKNIRTRDILEKVKARYEGEERYYKKTGRAINNYPDLQHYLNAFVKVGCWSASNGPQVFDMLAKLTQEEWEKFCDSFPEIFSIDWVYRPGMDAQAKVNQIANALGMIIYSDNLPDEI